MEEDAVASAAAAAVLPAAFRDQQPREVSWPPLPMKSRN